MQQFTQLNPTLDSPFRESVLRHTRPIESMGTPTFSNRILHQLPYPIMMKISSHLKPVYLSSEQQINQPEDPIDYIYFPETAVFSEYQMLEDGRTIEISMTGRESMIGAAAAFSPGFAVNWTQACVPGTAFRIESEYIRREIGREILFASAIHAEITAYIQRLSMKVICNTYHSVEQRLCSWLLMLNDRCGDVPIKFTHDQIARVLGVYRPSVTIVAKQLRTRGLLEYVRGKILVGDRNQLAEIACSCYRSAVTLQSSPEIQ